MTAVAVRTDTFARRAARARDLAAVHVHAADPLHLYGAVAEAQGVIYEQAAADRPARAVVPTWVATGAIPRVIDATMRAGTAPLRERALVHFGTAVLEDLVESWLAGEAQDPIDAYLARAATSPVLEALPELCATLRDDDGGGRCPRCGGRPQLAVLVAGGADEIAGGRRLVCARCATEWPYPRMTCAWCGETGGRNMPVLSDVDRLGHVRVDACDDCRRYLLTIDLRKEPRAVPLADEIAALPLDLAASDRGYTKIERNLMGF